MYKKLIWSLFGATLLIALALYFSSMSLPELEEAILHTPHSHRPTDDRIRVESILRDGRTHISVHRPVFGQRLIDEQLAAFINERIALFEELNDFTSGESVETDLVIEYEVIHHSPEYISLLFREKKNTTHTPNSDQIFTFNFDAVTQRRLTLTEFFPGADQLYHTFFQYAQQNILDGLIPNISLTQDVTKAIAPIEYNYHNFTVDPDQITFYIRPGEQGIFPLSIPFQEFSGKTANLPVITASATPDSPSAFQLRAPIVANDPNSPRKKVALIFLDGPHHQHTESILNILYERQTRATFAPLGIRAAEFESLLRRILWEGHTVENHGWIKPAYARADILEDFRRGKELLSGFDIMTKRYIIPGAVLTASAIRAIPAQVLTQVTFIHEDNYPDPLLMIQEILQGIDHHRILCFNESSYTVQVLPKLIDALFDASYEVDLLDAVNSR